jgi:hypothetical protein
MMTNDRLSPFRQELKKRHIDVRSVYELDARKSDEVLSVFHSTLEDIVGNQKTLDEKLYNARYDQVKQLFSEVEKLAGSHMELFPVQCVGIINCIRAVDSYGENNKNNYETSAECRWVEADEFRVKHARKVKNGQTPSNRTLQDWRSKGKKAPDSKSGTDVNGYVWEADKFDPTLIRYKIKHE